MKTVRLPIFEDGVETGEMLEVDITFWISPTRGIRSSQARVLQEPLADWERELLGGAYAEENKAAVENELELIETGGWGRGEEWKTIDTLPTKNFEVNQRGQVRIKANKKILEPSLDLDSKNYMTVNVKINGLDFYINGPKLAEQMWSRAV